MAHTELPALTIASITATSDPTRLVLVNRDPAPADIDVPLTSTITLELVDTGADGIATSATRVWVNGEVAFDGASTTAFAGPRAAVTETVDTLRIVLDPIRAFASLETVTVRVRAASKGGASALDTTYAFTAEDRTAPKLVAATATAQRTVRIGFDEPVAPSSPASFALQALSVPAVPITVVSTAEAGRVVDLTVMPEMTPGARYELRALDIVDLRGNAVQPPFDRVEFIGFQPARSPRRRLDLWSMLPKHNRRADLTGDLARFIACLQEVTDLLLAEVDRFEDIYDFERAPEPFLDGILEDLGNPFPFELDTLGKRRLASVLVQMYRQKGTAVGVKNAVRFLVGIEVVSISGLAERALVLGDSELGVDWELGPSDRFARYAFSLTVDRSLSQSERKRLRAIVDYLKPAHTHFVDLVEPTPKTALEHWELGVSELGDTTILH